MPAATIAALRARVAELERQDRTVFDSLVDFAIVVTDLMGRVVDWNIGAEQVFGWTRDEMLGQHANRFFTPEDRAAGRIETEMRLAREQGRAGDERWHLRRDGSRFWAWGEMMPLKDQDGTHAGYTKVVRDRTEQHLAGRALEETQALLRRAQEAGGIGLFTVEVADNLLRPTPEFCRLYGLPVQAWYPATAFEERVVPEDRHLVSTQATRAAGEPPRDVEYRIRRADTGALRWIARRGEIEFDAGRPVRFVGSALDVTERREAQDALARSEAAARENAERVQLALAAGAIIGTWHWDIPGDRFTADEAFARSFGLDPIRAREGLQLGQVVETVHPDDQADLAAAIQAALARGGAYSHQYRVRRADGRYHWIEASGRVDRDASGTPLTFPGVLIDIEARRAVERERDRVAAELRAAAVRQDALLELGDRLRDLTQADAMTMAASEILGTTLGVPLVGYGDVDPVAETITVARDWTAGAAASLAGTLGFRDFGSYIEDLKRGDTVIVRDARTDPRTHAHAAALEARSARAFVNAPIFERGAFLALLYVSTGVARDWTADDLAFVREVADRLRAAIARARAEAERTVLNQELSHRLKNTLALVQSISRQTLKGVTERAAVEAFDRRVLALGKAHDLLLRQNWTEADITAVMTSALEPVAPIERFDVAGPSVRLGARATMSLSLVLHELATNAQKYGALSVEGGRVSVTWAVEDGAPGHLVLTWRETGGPPAFAPTRKGFGSRLIQSGLTGTGGADLRYTPDGLEAQFRAPMDQVGQL